MLPPGNAKIQQFSKYWQIFNLFVPNGFYRKVFWFLQGAEKGCIGNEWVNKAKNVVRDHLQISLLILNEFKRFNYGFLMISGGIEID